MARGKYCEWETHGDVYRATGSRDLTWYVRVSCYDKNCPDQQIVNVCRACANHVKYLIAISYTVYHQPCWRINRADQLYYVFQSVAQ